MRETESVLESLGVATQDEDLYRELLRSPGATIDTLAEATGNTASTTRRGVRRLEQLGLVTRLAGVPVRLMPARPDVAVDVLVAQRQQELARAQAAARTLLRETATERAHQPDELVEIVHGRQAVAQRFMQLEQTVTRELLVLDRPPYAQVTTEPNESELEMLARGVRCRGIYAPEGLELPGRLDEIERMIAAGEEARTSPVVPMKMAVADRRVALLPLTSEQLTEQALVVHAGTLVEALVTLFEVLWGLAVPLLAPAPGSADDPDARLVSLLAAGLSDQAIARQLEVSPRTLSRQLAALQDTLLARTRFQAGVHAALRGLAGG